MITKVAQPPWWPKVLSGIRKITNLPPEVRGLIDAPQRLVFHQATPAGADSMAKGYVSTEDSDDDGNLDTVNLVVTNMEKEIPSDLLTGINQMDETDPNFQEIVSNIAKTLVHELAHIEDYDPDRGFAGGEPVAESKERSFNPIFAHSTTNKNIGNDSIIKLNSKGELKMTKDIIKLANHLDQIGHKDLADRLDSIIKAAQELPWEEQPPALIDLEVGEKPANEVAEDCGAEGCITGPTGIVFSLGHKCFKDKKDHSLGTKDCYQIVSTGDSKAAGIEQWEGMFFSGDHRALMQELSSAREWVAQKERASGAEQPNMTNTTGSPDLVDDSDDYLAAGQTTQDKINKLAELMAGELSSGTPGSFYRR